MGFGSSLSPGVSGEYLICAFGWSLVRAFGLVWFVHLVVVWFVHMVVFWFRAFDQGLIRALCG